MGNAKDNLEKIVELINQNEKARTVFVTNVAGKDINWEMSFQFKLDGEDPFYLLIKDRKLDLFEGSKSDAIIVMTGDATALVNICEGKGDFTHAISREQITVQQGKVFDVIRLTRAINIVLQKK